MPTKLLLPPGQAQRLTPNPASPQLLGLHRWYAASWDVNTAVWREALRLNAMLIMQAGARSYGPELGPAWSFDGVNTRGLDNLNGEAPETSSWTLTAWIRPTAVTVVNGAAILGHASSDASAGSWSTTLGLRNSVLDCLFFNGSTQKILGTTTLVVNTLYHVAFVADTAASYYKVYLNGVDDTASAPSTTTAPSAAVNRLAVAFTTGSNVANGGYQSRYAGLIHDMRRYTRALGPAEIWAQWAVQTRLALYAPVVRLHWPLATVPVVTSTSGAAGARGSSAASGAHALSVVAGAAAGSASVSSTARQGSATSGALGANGRVLAASAASRVGSLVGALGAQASVTSQAAATTLVPGSLTTLFVGI